MTTTRLLHILVTCATLVHCGNEGTSDSAALVDSPSAARLPGETYAQAEERFVRSLASGDLDVYNSIHSARSLAEPFVSTNLEKTLASPNFATLADLEDAFIQGRDTRALTDPDQPDLLRRATWLYPDDGCYARADLLSRWIAEQNNPRPYKIFAFGDLAVSTSNASQGYVTWWYHVAPIAKADDQLYVLDPAVYPTAPLPLATWLASIANNPDTVEVVVCNAFTYGPQSRCLTALDAGPDRAIDDEVEFLSLERDRLEALGRDAASELGDTPPW